MAENFKKHVSWSEIRTWVTCRKRWWWNYDVGIVVKRPHKTPYFGSLGHVGLAKWYETKKMNEVKKAIKAYLKKTYLDTQDLFDEDRQDFIQLADTVIKVIERYVQQVDDSGIVKVHYIEKRFEIPIRALKTKLVGYWDLIAEDAGGSMWLVEHKFPKILQSETDILLNGQIGTYQWAALRLDIDIVGTLYNQVLQKLPTFPSETKKGLSVAEIYCTWEDYKFALIRAGLSPKDLSSKGTTYEEEMRPKLVEKKFFSRLALYRPKSEITKFARDLERKIWDLCRVKKHIYMSANPMNCNGCPYKELCLEELKGGDVNWLIENTFEPKKKREDRKVEEVIDAEVEL